MPNTTSRLNDIDIYTITGETVMELSSTYNLCGSEKTVILLQNAIKSAKEYSKAGILLSPLGYVVNLSYPDYASTVFENIEKNFTALSNFTHLDSKQFIDNIDKEKARNKIRLFNEPIAKATEEINKVLDERRSKINTKKEKQEYREKCTMEETKILTFRFLEAHVSGVFKIEYDKIKWNSIDLFLTAFDGFLKRVVTVSGMKFKENDWSDLLNMLYVSPRDMYWTYDKRWYKLIEGEGDNKACLSKDISKYSYRINE